MIRYDRFFAVHEVSKIFGTLDSINDIPDQVIKELEQFFVNYNQLEEKKLHILCMMTVKEARQIMGSNKKSKLRKR